MFMKPKALYNFENNFESFDPLENNFQFEGMNLIFFLNRPKESLFLDIFFDFMNIEWIDGID